MSQRALFTDDPNLTEFYRKHLKSEMWKAKRREIYARSKGRCEMRWGTRRCENQAVDVHHDTYHRLGNELISDLRHLCRECHQDVENQKVEEKKMKAVLTFAETKFGPNWFDAYDYDDMEAEFEYWLSGGRAA